MSASWHSATVPAQKLTVDLLSVNAGLSVRDAAISAIAVEILEAIAGGAAMAEVLRRITLAMEGLAENAAASVVLLEDGRIRDSVAPSLPAAYSAALAGLPIGPASGSCGTAMYRAAPVIVTDIATDPLWADYRDLALSFGLRACWSTPVIAPDGRVLASFALYYRVPRAPLPTELDLAQRFAHLVAITIEHERTVRSLRERVKELRAVYDVLALMAVTTRPLRDVLADIAHVVAGAMQYEHLAVARIVASGFEQRSANWRVPDVVLQVPFAVTGGQPGLVEVGYAPAPPEAGDPFMPEEHRMIAAVAAHIGTMLENRRVADTAMQRERLSAVGELTGGVAHDFNNLLTVIMGNAEALVAALPPDGPLAPLAQLTLEAAERGADLTSRLLAFARRQPLAPQPVTLTDLFARLTPLLERALGATIRLTVDLVPNLPPILADRGQLENALLNLAVNARDAMPNGGRLIVAATAERVAPGRPDWPDDVPPGRYVAISVTDTGTGMGAAVRARVFEPFFTTKEVGRGSGLGLSMVHGFARQSNGHVAIHSEPDRGTTVTLHLPIAG